ncbi:MAG: 50S ribosomal protein L15 [Candidatus Babeliales bacterium]
MAQLNNLPGLCKKRKRVGRGGARGGSSGRGTKGQRARSGGKRGLIGFEGGQMPLSRRLPKRGFSNTRFATKVQIVNLETLERVFNEGDVVSQETLRAKGLVKGQDRVQVKILGTGQITKKLIITADAVSGSARAAIEQSGGQLHLTKE